MSKPIHEFLIENAKTKDGETVPYIFTLTASRRLTNLSNGSESGVEGFGRYLIENVEGIEGIEFGNPHGYTIRFMVASTFDPVAVQKEIVDALKLFQSDLVLPSSSSGRMLKFAGK